jgi:hypothetical protein
MIINGPKDGKWKNLLEKKTKQDLVAVKVKYKKIKKKL